MEFGKKQSKTLPQNLLLLNQALFKIRPELIIDLLIPRTYSLVQWKLVISKGFLQGGFFSFGKVQ